MSTNVLLVYPENPTTFWSFKHALTYTVRKSTHPPLGLITIAAMLPKDYHVKLIDMNVVELTDEDIQNADLVMTSTMIIHRDSLKEVVKRVKKFGKPIVAGGPHPTHSYDEIEGIDHFVLNEAEITLPKFLKDFKNGVAKPVYLDDTKPSLTDTPVPDFSLLDHNLYGTMAIQYSRGCPFNCEFCDIIELFGRKPRVKTPTQLVAELEALYQTGYKGEVFIVDDNFIGNKKSVRELLPEVIKWQKRRKLPFTFHTEASINLADDDNLLDLMYEAGFNMVFIGIETPSLESLEACNKIQNLKGNLLDSIIKIQKSGLEVTGGFIVGFDSDEEDIFDRQIEFIKQSGVPTAMLGILQAMPHTQLSRRMEKENRLLFGASGNQTHGLEVNFIPKMDKDKLIEGYKRVLMDIFDPKTYFERCSLLISRLNGRRFNFTKPRKGDVAAVLKSVFNQPRSSYGIHYIKFMLKTLFTKPKFMGLALAMSIRGHHLITMTGELSDVVVEQRQPEFVPTPEQKGRVISPS